MTVVEVVPLVAGTAPVIVRSGVVGAVVGVLGLLVQGAGLGVLDERLGVQVSCLLAVKSGAHLERTNQQKSDFRTEKDIPKPVKGKSYVIGAMLLHSTHGC